MPAWLASGGCIFDSPSLQLNPTIPIRVFAGNEFNKHTYQSPIRVVILLISPIPGFEHPTADISFPSFKNRDQ